MYRLTIDHYVANEQYEEEVKKYQQQKNQYYTGDQAPFPQREIPLRSLLVDITDEEFAAIKKAVLEVM